MPMFVYVILLFWGPHMQNICIYFCNYVCQDYIYYLHTYSIYHILNTCIGFFPHKDFSWITTLLCFLRSLALIILFSTIVIVLSRQLVGLILDIIEAHFWELRSTSCEAPRGEYFSMKYERASSLWYKAELGRNIPLP